MATSVGMLNTPKVMTIMFCFSALARVDYALMYICYARMLQHHYL